MKRVKFWVSTGPFNEIYVYEDVSEEEYRILKEQADLYDRNMESCEGLSDLHDYIIEDACYNMQDGVIETDEYQEEFPEGVPDGDALIRFITENYDLYVRWPDLSAAVNSTNVTYQLTNERQEIGIIMLKSEMRGE